MREEENKRSSKGSRVKRFFKKRWVFPAIYIASAAIILTGVLWYQSFSSSSSDKYSYTGNDAAGQNQQPAVEVNKALENFKMPVASPDEAVVKMGFYDFKASPKDQEAALVFYNNTYQPNTGIDLTSKDGKSFDVVASLSGTVTRVDEDSVLGNVVEVDHGKGIVTQYQSVKNIKVKVGDQVKQGQTLATAGQSLFNEKAGTHVHFEIRKDGVAVNPSEYINKPLSALEEAKVSNTPAAPDSGKSDPSNGSQMDKSNGSQDKTSGSQDQSGSQMDKSNGSQDQSGSQMDKSNGSQDQSGSQMDKSNGSQDQSGSQMDNSNGSQDQSGTDSTDNTNS